MSSASTTRPSRSRRRAPDDGPRASLRQLLPFVFEQKGVLVVVAC
jgi:ATP-binding cassette subfamily B protein